MAGSLFVKDRLSSFFNNKWRQHYVTDRGALSRANRAALTLFAALRKFVAGSRLSDRVDRDVSRKKNEGVR